MGNKVLGKRAKSFYRGFSVRQVEYLKEKFQMMSKNGILEKELFMRAYHVNKTLCESFFMEVDFDQNSEIDEYEFICSVHSLCSLSVEELSHKFYRILTKGRKKLTKEVLLSFTEAALKYSAYLHKIKLKDDEIEKMNKNKFNKYDYDGNGYIDEEEFMKMCLKDEHYKLWMYNMGFITKRQMDFQAEVYDLVDSDICDEVDRHCKTIDPSVSKIKEGIEHRLEDEDDFELEEEGGDQSVAAKKPWQQSIRKLNIGIENKQSPAQNIQMEYVFGYRSFDCRNNVKFDASNRVVYHQAAIGIVMDPNRKDQKFIVNHHDDISCLDISDDMVVTGQVGAKPIIMVWESQANRAGRLEEKLMVSEELRDSVGNVCISKSQKLIAASCNDEDHHIVVYSLTKLLQKREKPLMTQTAIIASGPSTKNIIFDIKFTIDEKCLVVATLRQILFIDFHQGNLNGNRGVFGNFSITTTLCLLSLKCSYKNEPKQYMLSGMGNGSVYFWENGKCCKAVCGHSKSVCAIAERKDCRSFVSGDKNGKIIVWDEKFQKEKTFQVPETNCPSKMIVSLSCSRTKDILVGTKASDIYTINIKESSFEKAVKIMSGHNEGHLWALTLQKDQPYLFTGGEDNRLIKWGYVKEKAIVAERNCPYPIRSLDFSNDRKLVAVGYRNGVIECYKSDKLDKTPLKYTEIKNPDEQVLNLIRFDETGGLLIACYQLPYFKIQLIAVSDKNMKKIEQIKVSSKVIALDFDKKSENIRFNTQNYEYFVYSIKDFKKPEKIQKQFRPSDWASHTLPFSPQTQGIMAEGVYEDDIVCCQRSRKNISAFVIGDKFSKIKLFNYPSKENPIFNKYIGHSNEVTGLRFNNGGDYLISIGGEEKSIIVWKYDGAELKNQWFIKQIEPEMDELSEKKFNEEKKKKLDDLRKFGAVEDDDSDIQQVKGEQARGTKEWLGQLKLPSDYKKKYNPRKDNKLPDETISIKHVFGIRNKYLNDEVRNQCKFSADGRHVLFPTACLAVKMKIDDRTQQFYQGHKEDIVCFAVDKKRQVMATGQMAQKNPYQPRKKILSIYVWDIEGKKMLKKLDGFHTIAIVLLQFSPSSKLLFSCGDDDKKTFAVYDWMSGSILYSGPVSRAKVNGIAWKTDNQFATCGLDHVKFWTGGKGMLGKLSNKKSEGMFTIVKSKNVYVTGSGDGGLYNWKGNISGEKIKMHAKKVQSLVEFEGYVYSGGDDGIVYQWRTQQNGQIKAAEKYFDTRSAFTVQLQTISIQEEEFGVLSIDFYGRNMIVATKGASVIYRSNKAGEVIHQGHYKGELWGLSTQIGEGRDFMFVTGGDDHTVRLWDINNRSQINRVYFQNKVRGIDWGTRSDKVVIADQKSKIFLYNGDLTKKLDEYTGKPYENNKNSNNGWVEDIKFSPDNHLIVYGCHGRSLDMEFLKVNGNQLMNHKTFSQGSSALLHVDWSTDSSTISLNNFSNQLLFYGTNGKPVSASSTNDNRWATWTQKFGFPVQGIFQGVDYTDVNTVCRDPTEQFMAVGYDDQTIRLFRYPCYIPKQVHSTYYGHSSHVTRVKFTSEYLVSLGGLDRTIIVWNIKGKHMDKMVDRGEESDDGLDDIDADVDLPNKAIRRKEKKQVIEEFYEVEDEGDEFMAVKPWLGAIKQPTYEYPKPTTSKPKAKIELTYVQGYRTKDCRQNLFYADSKNIIYHAAAVVIKHDIVENKQTLDSTHNDDIISIDYHKETNQVVTGQIGPKPLVCIYKDNNLEQKIIAPVTKGVLAVGFSADGSLGACAGMDDNHHVAVFDVRTGDVLVRERGTRKVITKLLWVSNSQFVTIGINHYKYWTLDGKRLSSRECRERGNYVSIAYDADSNRIFTGSKGCVIPWRKTSMMEKDVMHIDSGSVVECLKVHKGALLAGTKDGMLFVYDLSNLRKLSQIPMKSQFNECDQKTENPCIRAIDVHGQKIIVGTLGAQIYELEFGDLKSDKSFRRCKNIMKCHYSPNNTWTNEVWGLDVYRNFVVTCSDDATLRVWKLSNKPVLLGCVSVNVGKDNSTLEKDKRTKDFTDSAKARCVKVSPDGSIIVVGSKNGTIRVYSFRGDPSKLKLVDMFRHAKQWISDIKFAYNTLIVGSHDNAIYVYNYEDGKIKLKYRPMKKHSSYITHMDVSRDSCFLQSTCGAYQLLFWDLNTGKQITSGATMLRDERWSSWTCNLGWPVQGIYPKCTDGTYINAVDRSHQSINRTLAKMDSKSPYLLAAGNDSGKVTLYNYPSTIKSSKYVQGRGHSSHVTNVRWSDDDEYVVSTGGQDQCVMFWKVTKNA